MGSHFNVSWFWTKANYTEIYKVLPLLDKPIFHICSGVSSIGDIRLDRSKIDNHCDRGEHLKGSCNIKGDMNNLPFKSGIAGSVICDPPYDYNFTKSELISEIVRICKPRGKILFIAPWIPNHKNISVINTELWNVGKRPYHKVRTLFYKSNAQLDDFFKGD